MALCRFIYGVIKTFLCSKRVVHVHYVAIDDLVITTPLKNDIIALWSCSGRAGASLLGQDVVASLLSLCMAKWLRKWRWGWLYAGSNTKNAKSLLSLFWLIGLFHMPSAKCGGGKTSQFAMQPGNKSWRINTGVVDHSTMSQRIPITAFMD